MANATPLPLSAKSQKHFINYYTTVQNSINTVRGTLRSRYQELDRLYQREMDLEKENQRAIIANKQGASNRYQNITVPVVMPQVEAATVYQTSVFLTGSPLFGVVSDPQFMDSAMQLESIIEQQSVKGGWTRQFMKFFRDGFKYNFAALEVSWENQNTYNVDTDLAKNKDEGVAKKVIWSGNTLKHLDVYNTFVDFTVDPADLHEKGEFGGYTEFMGKIELKRFIAELPDKQTMNVKAAFESGSVTGTIATIDKESRSYYIPYVNPEVDSNRYTQTQLNWAAWANLDDAPTGIEYKSGYEVTTLYCRIIPAEYELKIPARNTVQIFKLIIVNHEHIVYAERQTNAHNLLPILVGQPLEDGLSYQTKSLAKNAEPFQSVASAYMNSVIASRRRAITDRVLFDPSRVKETDINSENPSAKIPVRPSAYGKDLSMANTTNGQNKVSQGQFVKGNKTRDEFQETMQNANGRDQMAAILLEAQIFVPFKHILKSNILQFQGSGDIYSKELKKNVTVDPIELRKSIMEFKISDGLIPSTKIINADTMISGLQTLATSPQMGQGYNLAPMFSYLMKTQGADLSPFEKSPEQVAYEQAMQSWQQVAIAAAEKGLDLASVQPAPTPEQFGYQPAPQAPVAEA